jgi:hypothetical protein
VLIRWRTMRSLTRTVRQIKLPLMRLDHQHPGARPMTFPALRIQANFISDRFHRDRDLVGDLQSARQHGQGEGCAIIICGH